ncbi:SMI1/KNR4 family protein, partial [Streptomyces corynorhini]
MKTYNWRPFLERWSADWTGSPAVLGREDGAGALGFAPAGEERVAALEARLGMALPPTYRSFLATTDGWRAAGTGIRLLGTADGVRRHGDGGDRWSRALLLSAGSDTSDASGVSDASDGTEVLLDPDEVSADGEWAAYLRRPGRAGP